MSETCDILVIGGGPGGSACATLLADRGFAVTLLERAAFPREHVGESLLPASIPVLEQIGAMPAIEAAGFVAKRGATLVWGKNPEPWSWYFADDPEQRPTSFQVVRSEFDKILLDNARAHGVDVRERHQVIDVEFETELPKAVRYLHEGKEGRIEPRFVVDASGQAALLSRKLQLQQWDSFFQNLAVYGYYRGAKHLEPPNDGNIFIESYQHGWLWKIPLHTGVTSVGAVVDKGIGQSGLREQGASGFLAAQIALAPHTRALLQDARLVGEPQVERDWSYRSSSFAGDGYVLVGDAACFVDPLFSSGVHLALGSAALAASYVATALNDPSHRREAAAAYQAAYEKQYDYFHLTAQLFYGTNRTADSYFWEARRLFAGDLGDATPREAFVRVVGGQPPHGYERAVIERGELPPEIAEELERRDRRVRERQTAAESATADLEALLRAAPALAPRVRLAQSRNLSTSGYKQAFRLVVEGGQSDGYPITAVMAACIGKMDGRMPLSEIINAVNAEHNLRGAERLTEIIQRDLPTLIGAGLIDVNTPTVGRNQPCPCGSGKKYKRCHGA